MVGADWRDTLKKGHKINANSNLNKKVANDVILYKEIKRVNKTHIIDSVLIGMYILFFILLCGFLLVVLPVLFTLGIMIVTIIITIDWIWTRLQ